MNFSDVIKEIRHKCYLSQQSFADSLGVSFSTVNRWENGKAIPNYQAMKRLIEYCKEAQVEYDNLERIWKENKNDADTH